MSTRSTDRRHPRITVTEVRRDLREADEDRFQLAAAVAHRGSQGSDANQGRSHLPTRLLGILLAVGAGVVSAVGMTRAPEAQVIAAQPPAPLPRYAVSAPVESAPFKEPAGPEIGKTKSAPRITKRSQRDHATAKSRARPRSPGEFGRFMAAHPSN